ncbi:hypothetical protein [Nannocystis punicea]|uniref:Uncharacterized protein n=1 Tax=Nannocystis punicea TaxID=2995304 RepID=A0ABY7HHV5_9BACT|nr:hypothetical protein [Nannocystis poenicansa]WAS98894.1 hypothetical protein O0S08_22415 [Nannocystis poenicansa]
MSPRHSRARRRARRGEGHLRMELAEALRAIRDPQRLPMVHVAAADTLVHASPEEVGVDDLLECLRRGHIAAELAAYALNLRLGRRSAEQITAEDNIVDVDYWIRYAAQKG